MANPLVALTFAIWLADAPMPQDPANQPAGSPPAAESAAPKAPAAGEQAAPKTPPKTPPKTTAAPVLPPLPEGVTELKFAELFAPVGPRGLEFTEKARALDGKRVRILGYMVKTCRHDHGRFLLSPFPIALHDHEMGPADDLPPSTVFVDVPPFRRALKYIPHETGLFLLTGKLSLGGRDELHGRRSWIRLELERPGHGPKDQPTAEATTAPVREQVSGVDTDPSAPAPQRNPTTPAAPATPPTPMPAPARAGG